MTQNRNYMSDEELELLIADVEQNELVAAPPDMLEKILEHIEEDGASVPQDVKSGNNLREFRKYCFKVCASVAAAVILIFALPEISDNPTMQESEQERFIMESRYATKEEALNDQGYFTDKFGGTNIFSGDRELGIFTRKNGG